jgi:D-serine deaminase-like pyridoxal phosphate-dependent protein
VVGRQKAARLAALLDRADVVVAVDSVANGEELSAAAEARGKRLRVIVEIDNGMQRAGVPPGEPTVELARRLAALPGLRFCGLMAWEAHCVGRPMDERRQCCEEAVGKLVATARECRAAGLDAEIVSCGGTGTFRITAGIEGITEIQAGGGIFNDVLYESWGIEHPFALTVMTTVTSRPTPRRIITDAGRKAMSVDIAMPRPVDLAHVDTVRLSAEHGVINLTEPNTSLAVGDRLEWIVGYGDTTVFLHDEVVATRGDRVEATWPVLARGRIK